MVEAASQARTGSTVEAGGTRARIQAVALELFVAQGYEKTSLREIAEPLGITKAALYYHFPSKELILEAIVGGLLADHEELLSSFEPGPVAAPARRRMLGAYVDLALRHRTVVEFLMGDATAVAALDIGRRAERDAQRLRALLVASDAPFADQVRAQAALGAVQVGVLGFLDADPAALRGPLLDAALAALRS